MLQQQKKCFIVQWLCVNNSRYWVLYIEICTASSVCICGVFSRVHSLLSWYLDICLYPTSFWLIHGYITAVTVITKNVVAVFNEILLCFYFWYAGVALNIGRWSFQLPKTTHVLCSSIQFKFVNAPGTCNCKWHWSNVTISIQYVEHSIIPGRPQSSATITGDQLILFYTSNCLFHIRR